MLRFHISVSVLNRCFFFFFFLREWREIQESFGFGFPFLFPHQPVHSRYWFLVRYPLFFTQIHAKRFMLYPIASTSNNLDDE